MGETEPAVVRQILSERELAIEMELSQPDLASVLIDEALGELRISPRILWRPPVAQGAMRVEFSALVIEQVDQLVAGDGSQCSELKRRIRRWIKKGSLQNSRGKRNFIQDLGRIPVELLRQRSPLGSIRRPLEF